MDSQKPEIYVIIYEEGILPFNQVDQRRLIMRINLPTKNTFYISLVLAVLGLILSFGVLPALTPFAIWFVIVGYAYLVTGLFVKGM